MTDSLRALITHELRMEGPGLLEGWTDAARGIELAQLILDEQPAIVVEIGVFGGRSLLAQAFALRELGRGHIYGIDPWKQADALEAEQEPANRAWWSGCDLDKIHSGAMQAIWAHNLDEWVTVIRAASQHCCELFRSIDFLSIDGNHSALASCRDVMKYGTRVRSGGVIIFDDANWQSTQDAITLLGTIADLIKDGGAYRVYRKK